jgi:hypothetical protein
MAEEQKSWWQTAAGLMTGVAALITAFTGLLVAIHQIRKDSEGVKPPVAEQSAATHAPSPGDSSKALKGVGQPAPAPAPRKIGPQRMVSAPPVVDRPVYDVALPAKREFALGLGQQTGRFILTSARVEPHAVESDILKVSVQVLADGQRDFPFNDSEFELRIDEEPYKSTTNFSEFIPVGQLRDHDLHFTIPHGPARAVLWIHAWLSNAEIPLDITPGS